MHVTVRFFATLRNRAETEQASVELPDKATVATLLEQLAENYPALQPALDSALVAINYEYAFPSDTLNDEDEVAIFPPVSGGSGSNPDYFAITSEQLDYDAITAAITCPEIGAVCIFAGTVRGVTQSADGDRNTNYLIYEAYQPMAEQKLRQVGQEIREKYPKVQGVAIVQRIGKLEVGNTTTLVACSSGHRSDGIFDAARYGIDRLKEIVPVWKQEVGPDGSMWVEGQYHPTPDDIQHSILEDKKPMQDSASFTVGCTQCSERYPYDTHLYRCPCGSSLEVVNAPVFDYEAVNTEDYSLWRYRAMLAPSDVQPVTMGEGWTPLITTQIDGQTIHLKLESLNPTGSFKDRGATLVVSLLKAQKVNVVHDDSSGNAGVALAAYSARAGIAARLFVPAGASPVKLGQIALYGAQLDTIPGPRSAATVASQEVANTGTSYYASHIYHPFAILAYKSTAYELWEQLGHRAPDAIILPLGHGSQLLGLARGFDALLAAGLIARLPRLIGVQARACAPLWQRYHQLSREAASEQPTLAEGIRIIEPVRAESILEAVKVSNGDIVSVDEDMILDGLRQLAKRGISAEPTSAVVWPALKQVTTNLPDDALIVLSITGSGYKTPHLDKIANHSDF